MEIEEHELSSLAKVYIWLLQYTYVVSSTNV